MWSWRDCLEGGRCVKSHPMVGRALEWVNERFGDTTLGNVPNIDMDTSTSGAPEGP